MPNEPNYLLRIDRATLAHLGGVKKALIVLSGISALSVYPWVAPTLLGLREILSYYESVCQVRNPLE